jgi:hypothetical protein
MKTREDVESYLMRGNNQYEEVSEGMWVVRRPDDSEKIVVKLAPPVCVVRLKVMEVPREQEHRAELYQTLLELNVSDMLHGAYGLEAGNVVLTDALQLENLDYNEFQATLDEFTMAIAAHYGRLSKYRSAAAA